ncbi:MAG: DUF4238 domain-containing protein [Bacteroidota bacterium]
MGKQHHYIPRFYLKRFSINDEGKCIALYNLKNKKFIQNAPIKHQACSAFLYGTDDLIENELAKLEGIIARFMHFWIDKKILDLPPQNSPAFTAIKRFILYQIFRTVKEGNHTLDLLDQAFKAFVHVHLPNKVQFLDGAKVFTEDSVLLSLLHAMDKDYLLNFLKCRFILNLTDLPFITSDAPVVRYNQLMEEIGLYTGATGLSVKGLQIFFPIHARLMICLFDPKVYACGKEEKDYVVTESMDDIHQLNALQYLNCDWQLFFDELVSQEYIEYIAENYEAKRAEIGPFSKLIKTSNKIELFSSSEDAQIDLKLTFFEILSDAKKFKHELAPLRHPSLARINYQ